jgi:hypothetical protein
MTLFCEIQSLFERTYSAVGINLEDCLISEHRSRKLSQLAGASARELSGLARTFLRRTGDQLRVGIYYSGSLIEELERHDPRRVLHDGNIRSLIIFVEEINHAVHAALQFRAGVREIQEENFARNLELQAQIDTYLVLLLFVAFFRKAKKVSFRDRRWLRWHLFDRVAGNAYHSARMRERYCETRVLAHAYTSHLDSLNGRRRVNEIRRFHALTYEAKQLRIRSLRKRANKVTAEHDSN